MKTCSKCKRSLDESNFYRSSQTPDGLRRWCKGCSKEADKKYSSTDKRKEQVRDYMRERRMTPQGILENREYAHRYYKDHKQQVDDRRRERLATNPSYRESARLSASRKYHRHKDGSIRRYWKSQAGKLVMVRSDHKRRAMMDKQDASITPEQIELLFHLQDGLCACCETRFSQEVPPTIDHIIPVTWGGSLTIENVQLLCRSCNSSKGNRHSTMYRRSLAEYFSEIT